MNKITSELRQYIEMSYAFGRTHAALAAELNDTALGKKYGIGQATVFRIIRRGFVPSKCNVVESAISIDICKAIKKDVRKRSKLEAIAKKYNANSIGLDVGLKTERVRAIGTYGLTKKAAPIVAKKIDYVRRFLTAPVVSHGVCQGYY
jgi:hypothetical protein